MTTTATVTSATTTDNYKWKAFWTVAIALLVMVMDFSITFLALSTIADDFNVTLRAVTWVAIASSLTVSAIMLPLGRVADMAGRKKFHITGMVFFVVGALPAAAAPSLGMLTTAVAIGATAGPIVAGPMLQFFGWRSLFIFLAVPTTLAIFFAVKVLDDERIGSVKQAPNTRYDWPGAFLSAAALALMILTISNPLGFDWGSTQIIGGGILTVVLFVALIWWELRFSSPILNLRFFSNSTFAFSTITRLFGFIGASATAFLMPVFVQSFLGVSQVEAGMIMFVAALGMGIAGSSSGRLSDKFGFRIFTFIGIAVLFFTGIGLAFFDSGTPIWVIMLVLFINGLGMGLWMAPNMNATLSVIERKDYGSVSAFLNLVRNVGSVSGQAITTAIVTGVMAARGLEIELSKLAAAADGPAGDAFLDGWRIAFFVLLGFIVVSFVAALFTRPGKSPES